MHKFILIGSTTGILVNEQKAASDDAILLTQADLPKYMIDGINDHTAITQAVGSEFYICYVNDDVNKWEYELF